MKKFAIAIFSFSACIASAQNVKLQSGKKITAVSKADISMDMGEMGGGVMKMTSEATSAIMITGADGDSYKANAMVTKMKTTMDAAGQNMAYDSDDKSDTSSDVAKEMSKQINRPMEVLISKADGTIKDASPEKPAADDEGNPFAGLMGNQTPAAAASTAFFVIPAGKKAGDKWTDSTAENGLKAVKTYELQSVKNGIATIAVSAVTSGDLKKEAQGMEVNINLNGTSTATMTTDISSGLVQKISSNGTMSGTMDVMGQSLPISMTTVSESTYQ